LSSEPAAPLLGLRTARENPFMRRANAYLARFLAWPFSRRLVIYTLLLLAVVHLANIGFIVELYRATARAEEQYRTARAISVAEHASRSISAVDMVLESIVEKVSDNPRFPGKSVALHMLLHNSAARLPQLRAITGLDDQGRIVLDSRHYPAPPVEVPSRAYFAEQKKWRGVGLYIDRPASVSAVDGLAFFALSRPVLDSNGNVRGVIAAIAEPNYFTTFYEQTMLGASGYAALIRADGSVLAATLVNDDGSVTHEPGVEGLLGRTRNMLAVTRDVPGLPLKIVVASPPPSAAAAFQRPLAADAAIMTFLTVMATWMSTLLVRSARARETAEHRLADAIESAPTAFTLFDAENRLVMFNQRFLSIFGFRREEVVSGMHADELARASRRRRGTAGSSADVPHAFDCREPGETVEHLANGPWILTARRRTKEGGIVAFHADITPMKEQEEALRQSERVATSARERAETADRAKSAFLATMSHELRTPLNAIIGFAEITERKMFGPLPERYHDYSKLIRRSGDHLLAIINDILDVAKLQSGRMELHLSAVDVESAIKQAREFVAGQATANTIDIECVVEAGLPGLTADEMRIRQILINLMSNAVKFTPPGGKITVSARQRDGAIVIAVKDTGIGIAPEDTAKALEPFGQIDSEMSRRHEGTGLGLPLSKNLVELHGGSLEIESTLGVGTIVTLVFPTRLTVAREAAELEENPALVGGRRRVTK
jgi:PAS domain S-box-containing protein